MTGIYEYRAGRKRPILLLALGLSTGLTLAGVYFGAPLGHLVALGLLSILCAVLVVFAPCRGLRLEANRLIVAPRATPIPVAYDDILGAHIALSPEGDACSLHLRDRRRITIAPQDCPRALTLKSELENRGVLAALR